MQLSNAKKTKKYKALIVDVDGTLIANFTDLPSVNVTNAIRAASKVLHVGLATSRPLFVAKPILDHLQLSGPSIVTTGAEVVDSKTKKVLYERPIEQEDIVKISSIVSKNNLSGLVNDAGVDVVFEANTVYEKPLDIWLRDIPYEKLKPLMRELQNIHGISHVEHINREGNATDVIITHALATKQHGILEVARLLGIATHEMIGVGDGYNDFPLLMACGLKIAMANAIPDLKEIADYIAPSVDEEGIVDVINKFVLNI